MYIYIYIYIYMHICTSYLQPFVNFSVSPRVFCILSSLRWATGGGRPSKNPCRVFVSRSVGPGDGSWPGHDLLQRARRWGSNGSNGVQDGLSLPDFMGVMMRSLSSITQIQIRIGKLHSYDEADSDRHAAEKCKSDGEIYEILCKPSCSLVWGAVKPSAKEQG